MCSHQPPCAPAHAPDRGAARVVAAHPDQGWSLLCNHVVLFEDGGMLLPEGRSVPPAVAGGASAGADRARPGLVVAAA
jgi:hypothetical protein